MATYRSLILVLAAAPLVAASPLAAGCSSSSGSGDSQLASSAKDGGTDATAGESADAGFDGSSALSLKWQVTEYPALGYGFGGDSGTEVPDAGWGDAGAPSTSGGYDYGDGGMRGILGVKVCVYQNSLVPCVMSAADGTFTIDGLTPRTNYTLTFDKAGYRGISTAFQSAGTDMDGTSQPLFMNLAADPPPAIGVSVDWTGTGQIGFFGIGPAADGGNGFTGDVGATVTLTSPDGGAGPFGNGPFYVDNNSYFNLSAMGIINGLGWYFNVPPGTYELTLNDSVNTCRPIEFPFAQFGFPDPPQSVTFQVIAGYSEELAGILCTPNTLIVEAGAPSH